MQDAIVGVGIERVCVGISGRGSARVEAVAGH